MTSSKKEIAIKKVIVGADVAFTYSLFKQHLLKGNPKNIFSFKKFQISSLLLLLFSIGCSDKVTVDFLNSSSAQSSGSIAVDATKVCSGTVIAGVTGTANCSGGGSALVTEGLYVLASRNDILTDSSTWSSDWSDPDFLADLVSGDIDRSSSVLTLQSVYDNNDFINFFKAKYSAIPNPVIDSDGRYNDNPEGLEKKHYLESIFATHPDGPRPHATCGTDSGDTITERITHCAGENGAKAYYNGRQYGQEGEGDWRLVTLVDEASVRYEVWRDERTKLLWSDKTTSNYNWYRASGYVKNNAVSSSETGYQALSYNTSPYTSVCAEVNDSGQVIAGGADSAYDGSYRPTSDASVEKAFKGNLNASQGVLWKLPSISDWKLADVNGIRKVLPNMDYGFWSSSSYSYDRFYAWVFSGDSGNVYYGGRNGGSTSVRCVALSRD